MAVGTKLTYCAPVCGACGSWFDGSFGWVVLGADFGTIEGGCLDFGVDAGISFVPVVALGFGVVGVAFATVVVVFGVDIGVGVFGVDVISVGFVGVVGVVIVVGVALATVVGVGGFNFGVVDVACLLGVEGVVVLVGDVAGDIVLGIGGGIR